jgi:hypothetical protein
MGNIPFQLRSYITSTEPEALPLLELPVRLTRGQYLSLHRSGVSAPKQVWTLSDEALAVVVGDVAGRRIAAVRPSAMEAA